MKSFGWPRRFPLQLATGKSDIHQPLHLIGSCLDDNKRQIEIQKNVRETCPTYSVEDCWENLETRPSNNRQSSTKLKPKLQVSLFLSIPLRYM